MDPLTANIANDITGAGLNLIANEKGEVNMCVGIAEIRADSRAEGRVEGEMKKAISIALNMLKSNFNPEEIAKLTQLPLSKVRELTIGNF